MAPSTAMQTFTLSFDDAIERVIRNRPSLVAVDGLPCSGKSTLAERLAQGLGGKCIALDEFVMPERFWQSRSQPAFPFEYVRYEEFLTAVRDLKKNGNCTFAPFDWNTREVSVGLLQIDLTTPVVVEGVSTFNPLIAGLYDLRVFVESDRETTHQAALARSDDRWSEYWGSLFLPSVDLYMLTSPRDRAELVVAGRGASASRAHAA